MEPGRLLPFCIPMAATKAAIQEIYWSRNEGRCARNYLQKIRTRIRIIRSECVLASEPGISEECSVCVQCALSQRVCLLLVLAPGSTAPKKLPLIFNAITSSLLPGLRFPASGNASAVVLRQKQIADRLTLLIQAWWRGPIHCCLLADVLEWAEYGDGLSHKQSHLMNKTSGQVVVECLSRRVGMLTDRRA